MKIFFQISLVFILILGLKSCLKKEKPKPNILFILADDWSYPYSSLFGESYIHTPNIEKLAQKGVVFENAYCSTPSCTPSRASMLTGQYPHNLGEGVNLCGKLDVSIPTYVKILRQNGYAVDYDRKGWAPGDFKKMGYNENPCGEKEEFSKFIDKLPADQPFFFWFGSNDPHRPFDKNAGKKTGIDTSKIKVPKFLPDSPEIRADLADYFSEIERFDKEIGDLLAKLKSSGRLENTIIVVTSDNGMPFPHAKANLYDYGTRVPLIISSLSSAFIENKRSNTFVNLMDLMPTFLDIAGVQNQPKIDGKSLLPILKGEKTAHREEVFLERERHCLCRSELDYGAGYPIRAIRTDAYLYIQNIRPNRNPAGDEKIANTPSEYGDIDGGITKMFMMDKRNDPFVKPFFKMGFEKRLAEELYLIKEDPYNIHNVADLKQYTDIKMGLKKRLEDWQKQTNDPRLNGKGDEIDKYESTSFAWITRDSIIFWNK